MPIFTNADGSPLLAEGNLQLARCPHCGIANPLLSSQVALQTGGTGGPRSWRNYACSVCGGMILAASVLNSPVISELYPHASQIDAAIPGRPREFLKQAQESLGQPIGSIVLSAGAIDSMLKERDLTEGSLYSRIDKAAEDHIITQDMATWAHQVRLDANDMRHADENTPLPELQDAQRCLEFAFALAEVLFALPARVTRGIEDSGAPSD